MHNTEEPVYYLKFSIKYLVFVMLEMPLTVAKMAQRIEYAYLPIVDAIMEERRPNTHEKGNEIASARDCKSVTCSSERVDAI